MAEHLSWNAEQVQIYERIKRFRFDEGEAAFPFVSRLARDNGWSNAYAVQAITEYWKFVFLAIAAGHPVTSPDQVDQVWHLHLFGRWMRHTRARFWSGSAGRRDFRLP